MEIFTPTTRRLIKVYYFLFIALLISVKGFSQNVSINATGAPPNASAGLDIDFPDKGLLIPRVALTSTTDFAPLSAHVAGMVVYNTATAGDVVPGFYYDNGSKWIKGFISGSAVGDMLYWNGTDWVMVPIGLPGQFLQISGANIPVWGGTAMAILSTTAATSISGISALSGGNLTNDGGSAVLSRGVCWNTSTSPTIANNKTVDGAGTGIFTSSLTGLSPVTTYYVRAYAINSTYVNYGNEISFTTLPVLPTLAATTAASAITGTTANSGGNVTSTGGATILERGICFAPTTNPTIANSKVVDPAPGLGIFTSNLTGLVGYTTYYVRAYATNSVGTAYGTQVSFTTLRILPTLVTVAATNISGTSATSGGSMSWNGGGYSNYQAYGVAYSIVPNSATPTKVATNTTNYPYTTPIAPWTTNITGLAANTTYYIRSYLDVYSTLWTTVYGDELSFTTTAPTLPILASTTGVTAITISSATSGGNITSDGGAAVTVRGLCWAATPSPTTADSFSVNGSGTGVFSGNMTGLLSNNIYYVRAYATNSVGTIYANELTFSTCGIPIYTVGQSVAGGIVYYVDCSGQHGLIVATVDQGVNVSWGCSGTLVGASGTAIYTGLANTNAILAGCSTAGIPARLCANYTAGGLNLPGITNWYLPSRDELQLMKASGLVNPPSSLYTHWSSSEGSATLVSGWFFNGNYAQSILKTYANQVVVRAIRAF